MERNSRTFEQRIKIIDSNAEAISDFLRSQSLAGGLPSAVINDVFYPKYQTREHYDRCRAKNSDGKPRGGFGGLFSLTFTSTAASRAFFDTLPSYKGPSLGTSFTLACPYTILAHYWELEWAAKYGIEETLIRISVGTENKEELLKAFQVALNAACSAA
jgi:cystathionine gamma-synthase